MGTLITVIHVFTCVFLVIFVMLQSGKGAEVSASFAGGSQTIFGTSGGVSVVQKITGILAAVFFCTSLALTIIGGQSRKSLFEGQAQAPVAPQNAPAAPAATGGAAAPVDGVQQVPASAATGKK